MKVARIAGLCAALLCCAFAQRPTIPDHVAQNGGRPVSLPVLRDTAPVSLKDLAASDLAVLGKLVPQKAYMNDRQTEIYTEYEVIVQRVISDRLGIMSKSNHPGAPGLLVELLGGELVVNGTTVVLDDLSRTPWSEGASLLMFLQQTPDGKRFRLYGGSAGLFEVKAGGRIESRLKHEEKDKEVGALTFEQIVRLITPGGR